MLVIGTVSRPVEIGLRLTGIWPGARFKILLRSLWVFMMIAGQVLQYWYLYKHFSASKVADFIDCMSTTLPYSLLFLKLIIFWTDSRRFNGILTTMSRDWADCSTVDNNSSSMITTADLSRRYANAVMGVYTIAIFLYTSATLDFTHNREDDDEEQSRELLIKMEFPFEGYRSPIYECVLFAQFLQLLAVGSTCGMLDALIVTLMLHIGSQIEIMNRELKGISPKEIEHGLLRSTIRSLITRHYRIITLAEEVRQFYAYIALSQFLCNTLVICSIGFVIVISLKSDDTLKILIKTVFFYIAITLEAFVFCFAGEYLSNKSRAIGDAVYESLWYHFNRNDSRVMLLVMVRSQKELTISAGQFMDLSMTSFATIIKASVSYVSALNALV